jgi:hypothetical protein
MPSQKRPPELQSIFDELSRAGPFGSIEELNRLVALRTRDYNAMPQAELGDLSPDENPPAAPRTGTFRFLVIHWSRAGQTVWSMESTMPGALPARWKARAEYLRQYGESPQLDAVRAQVRSLSVRATWSALVTSSRGMK